MKRPKTKKFKHQKDLIRHAVQRVINRPEPKPRELTSQEKLERAMREARMVG